MSDVLMFSSVAMLVLLFLKVPVFVAVLGGSLIYFLMNPDINSLIFFFLCLRRYCHELYRGYKAYHGFL